MLREAYAMLSQSEGRWRLCQVSDLVRPEASDMLSSFSYVPRVDRYGHLKDYTDKLSQPRGKGRHTRRDFS